MPQREACEAFIRSRRAHAHRWMGELMSGAVSTAHEIADREGINERYVGKVMALAFLSPEITTAIIEGNQPVDLTTERLIRDLDLPLDWQSHAALLIGA